MRTICEICFSQYNSYDKYQHDKSVKHLAALGKYHCSVCNVYCDLKEKQNHLNSDEHNEKNQKIKEYCNVCNVYVSKIDRHNDSKSHLANLKIHNLEKKWCTK